jgi:murein DD-endopeptidase MepM/ murein hydrolase activator NlpD
MKYRKEACKMDDNYRDLSYGASEARFADVRAARERRRTARETPAREDSPWEDEREAERARGSFGRVMLTQAIVCALLVGGLFLCQKAMPNTYRQLRASYARVMQTDMSAKEVWAEIRAVFAQLKEDMYVMVPYQEAVGQGGLDVTLEYAAKRCAIAPLRTTARPARPVAEGEITSSFGYRIHPITGEEGVHTGMDIAATEGDPIYAAFYGTVAETGEGKEYGKYVLIDHAGGLQTLYAHCSEVIAEEGMVLRPGDVIALVGSTGNSTGPHLHFEVRLGGLRCDPAPLFGKEIYPMKEENDASA